MSPYDPHDASFEELKRLQFLASDSRRVAQVRMRCREQLSRSHKRPSRSDVITGFGRRVLAPFVVGSFCLLYIAALVATALRLFH